MACEGTDQAQLSLTLDQPVATHPGSELLQLKLFEVEKDSRFDLFKFLAKEAALASAQPHKPVGDRLVEAAAHQQPQVGAALLPFKGGAGQGG
jgi:hypothetical protein